MSIKEPDQNQAYQTMPVDRLLTTLRDIQGLNDVEYEIKKLRVFRDLLLETLPISVGDRAVLVRPFGQRQSRAPGWYHWRESLVAGAVGLVKSIDVSVDSRKLHVMWQPDVAWSIGTHMHIHRWLEIDPVTFALPIDGLHRADDDDDGIAYPGYCASGCAQPGSVRAAS